MPSHTLQRSSQLIILGLLLASSAIAPAHAATTITVSIKEFNNWLMDGEGDPTLTLVRGETYIFDLQNVPGLHPFYIKSVAGTGTSDQYNTGVTGNGATGNSNVTFVVPASAPSQLFYNCSNHFAMAGIFNIIDAPPLFASGFED